MATVAWEDVTTAVPNRRRPAPESWGIAASVALHLVLGAIILDAAVEPPPVPEEAPVEMVLVAPEPQLPPLQDVAEAAPPQPVEPPPPAAIEPPPPVEAAPVEPPPPPVIAEIPEETVAPPPPPPPPKPKVVKPAPPKPAPPKPAVAAVAPTPVPAPVNPAPAAAVVPPAPQPPGIPSDYVKDVRGRISRYALNRYPRAAQLKGQEGRVGYTLTLAPDGRVQAFDITPSGVETLDKAAAEALQNAGPYPKLPDLGAASYKLTGAIVYKLN